VEAETQPILTVKRNVTIKAVVTPGFKKYLTYEINQGIEACNVRINQIQELLKRDLGNKDYEAKLSSEKSELVATVEDMRGKLEKVKTLELNSYFLQGMIEGHATIKIGDPIYQKVGGTEVIVKDGIVQDIVVSDKFGFASGL